MMSSAYSGQGDNKPTTAELLFAAREEIHIFERPSRKNVDLLIERLEIAEALIKDIGELPDKWLQATRILSCQKGMDDCAKGLQAKLREHGHGCE